MQKQQLNTQISRDAFDMLLSEQKAIIREFRLCYCKIDGKILWKKKISVNNNREDLLVDVNKFEIIVTTSEIVIKFNNLVNLREFLALHIHSVNVQSLKKSCN